MNQNELSKEIKSFIADNEDKTKIDVNGINNFCFIIENFMKVSTRDDDNIAIFNKNKDLIMNYISANYLTESINFVTDNEDNNKKYNAISKIIFLSYELKFNKHLTESEKQTVIDNIQSNGVPLIDEDFKTLLQSDKQSANSNKFMS